MKLSSIIASLLLTALYASASAATDRSYYITELAPQQKFDVYNDGRNTFLQSIPGLIVTGATADGEFFIVTGVPGSIRGFMNGKPIMIVRGTAPVFRPVAPDGKTVDAEIKRLTGELAVLSAKTLQAPAVVKAVVPAPITASAAAPLHPGTPAEKVAADLARAAKSGAQPTAQEKAQHLTAKDVVVYQVTPNDHNLRMVIDNWAKLVGWSAIWDVEQDIPVSGSDAKENDFKSAVRRVLASTELGDLQVKPCFYSNDIIRVVRKTTKCNPNE